MTTDYQLTPTLDATRGQDQKNECIIIERSGVDYPVTLFVNHREGTYIHLQGAFTIAGAVHKYVNDDRARMYVQSLRSQGYTPEWRPVDTGNGVTTEQITAE